MDCLQPAADGRLALLQAFEFLAGRLDARFDLGLQPGGVLLDVFLRGLLQRLLQLLIQYPGRQQIGGQLLGDLVVLVQPLAQGFDGPGGVGSADLGTAAQHRPQLVEEARPAPASCSATAGSWPPA